jgi:hypothetical protein
MTEESANTELTAGQLETIPGYVKNKIKAHKSHKRASPASRARKAARKQITAKLAKIIKKAAFIGELLTEGDQEENLRVIREAKQACHVYITKKGEVQLPDHKTRLAAVALDLAYREGKPVERAEVLHGDAKDFPALIEKLNQSPAFQALEMGNDIAPSLAQPQ